MSSYNDNKKVKKGSNDNYENKKCFPEPLSNEEFDLYFEKMKNGDEEARKKLIGHGLRLVCYIVNRFKNTSIKEEELLSIGTIGLIKALDSFKKEKNILFATYSSRCIENEILMFLRHYRKFSYDASIDIPFINKVGEEQCLQDFLYDDINLAFRYEIQERNRIVREVVESLKDRDKMIIKLRYGFEIECLSQKEVGDILGISQSYISRLEKQILKKVENKLQNRGIKEETSGLYEEPYRKHLKI